MSGLAYLLDSIRELEEDYYVLEIEEREIVFYLPSIRQARQFQTLVALSETEEEKSLIYEHIFMGFVRNKTILEDPDLQAGLVESISKMILMYSGVGTNAKQYTKEVLIAYRNNTDSVLSFVKRTICQVFSGYTISSLNDVNYPDLINIFVEAEKVLLERGIIEMPFDLMAEEEKKTKPKPFRVEDAIRMDADAQREFDTDGSSPEDRLNKQRMMKLREDAKARAEEQERRHMRQNLPQR